MGFETTDITDERLTESRDNLVYLVLNERQSDGNSLQTYYNKVKDILKKGIQLYVIMVSDTQKIRGSICNLMVLYSNFNIYRVEDSQFISQAFLNTLPERTVTYDEVQTYMQSDLAAYDDMDTVLQGIMECINRNDQDGLRILAEEHLPTIEQAPIVFSNMRAAIDAQNSGIWQDKIASIKEQLADQDAKNEKKDKQIKEKEQRIDDLQQELKDTKRQLTQTKADMEELKLQSGSAGPVIRNYATVKTQLLKCKTENIIYIKEISQIPYINSFVTTLHEMVKQFRYNCKLLIYDNISGTQITYGNMQQVDQAYFESNKQLLMNKTQKFVVTEPAPQILKDILQNMNPQFDVVIVYDRLHQQADLVEGNNVYKFWVINSNNDYNATKSTFKIDRTSAIITRPTSSIAADVIDLPRIRGYEAETSDNGRFAKYKGIKTSVLGVPLMKHFLDMCNITRKQGT